MCTQFFSKSRNYLKILGARRKT